MIFFDTVVSTLKDRLRTARANAKVDTTRLFLKHMVSGVTKISDDINALADLVHRTELGDFKTNKPVQMGEKAAQNIVNECMKKCSHIDLLLTDLEEAEEGSDPCLIESAKNSLEYFLVEYEVENESITRESLKTELEALVQTFNDDLKSERKTYGHILYFDDGKGQHIANSYDEGLAAARDSYEAYQAEGALDMEGF